METTLPADTGTAAAVAAVIDEARQPVTAAAPPPAGRARFIPESMLSQNADAVRKRKQRAAAKARENGGHAPPSPTAPAPDVRPKFTPSALRELGPAPTPEPAQPAISPELLARATKFFALVVRGAGHVAAAVWKDDAMKVPDTDATEAAELFIDAYPEWALLDADGKKWLAWGYLGSLAAERYGIHQRRAAGNGPGPQLVRDVPAPPQPSGMMEPVTL